MRTKIKCPICLGAYSNDAFETPTPDLNTQFVDCRVCGKFFLDEDAKDDFLDPRQQRLSPVMRAALSHIVRKNSSNPARLTSRILSKIISDGVSLPTPSMQVSNLIRWIGDRVSADGEPVSELPPDLYAEVGSPNPTQLRSLLVQLHDAKILVMSSVGGSGVPPAVRVDLTLSGWDRYEAERRGKMAGDYGFVALQFGDSILDGLVSNHLRPALLSRMGYRLVDMRDSARAGVIDNLMRETIRDAAFVVVDLTHDNSGAYWEAGYAEGLGKPVLYICEKNKFDLKKTHFDTNHLTTVTWSVGEEEFFLEQFIATLQRSIR